MKQTGRMVHKLVAETAKEFAGNFYEMAASKEDAFYKQYPSQRFFIDYEWKKFVAAARIVLTKMMANPMTPEWQRTEIYDALQLDAQMPWNSADQIVERVH